MRDRTWETRAVTVSLRISELRQGSHFRGDLEPRRTGEKALAAVIQETYVHGVSTRLVGDLGKAVGVSGVSKSQVSRLSDAHLGPKAAATKVVKATWRRCWVHFWRNAPAHVNKTQRRMVSATFATSFAQETTEAADAQWRAVADQLRGKPPKLSALMDGAGHEVQSCMNFPRARWLQIHGTNRQERLNAAIKRRTNVVRIFPNDVAVARPVGAMPLWLSDEWRLIRRYMQLEGLQTLTDAVPTPACRAALSTAYPSRTGSRTCTTHSATIGAGDNSRHD